MSLDPAVPQIIIRPNAPKVASSTKLFRHHPESICAMLIISGVRFSWEEGWKFHECCLRKSRLLEGVMAILAAEKTLVFENAKKR